MSDGNKTKALDAFKKAQELDPNAYRASFDGAVNAAATFSRDRAQSSGYTRIAFTGSILAARRAGT